MAGSLAVQRSSLRRVSAGCCYQANVKWTVGGLILVCGVCFVVPGYLVYLPDRRLIILGIIVGLVTGARSTCLCVPEAQGAHEQV